MFVCVFVCGLVCGFVLFFKIFFRVGTLLGPSPSKCSDDIVPAFMVKAFLQQGSLLQDQCENSSVVMSLSLSHCTQWQWQKHGVNFQDHVNVHFRFLFLNREI